MIGSLPYVTVNQSPGFGDPLDPTGAQPLVGEHRLPLELQHVGRRVQVGGQRRGRRDVAHRLVEARQERFGENGHQSSCGLVAVRGRNMILLDLADTGAGKLVDEAELAGALGLARRSAHQPRGRLAGRPSGASAAARRRPRGTSSRTSSGIADDGGIGDLRVRGEHLLDLDRRDVLAGDLQHVGPAAGERVPAVVVASRPVAGQEPAVAERRGRGLGVVEVAGEEGHARLAADDDLAVCEIDSCSPRSRTPSCRGAGRRAHR